MNDKITEFEKLLQEARQVLDDWCEEYGHYELELMRDKIDNYFATRHLTKHHALGRAGARALCDCGRELSPGLCNVCDNDE